MASKNNIYSDALKGNYEGIIPLIESSLSEFGIWRTMSMPSNKRVGYAEGLRALGYKAEITRFGFINVWRK